VQRPQHGDRWHEARGKLARATGVLFLMSTLAMFVFTHVTPVNPLYVTIAITIAYPIASYLLNLLWVFKGE
jgi:hypothetical protein